MSELLDKCFAEINRIEGVEHVSSIPRSNKHYVERWKLSTEVEVSGVRHDLIFYIGFSESFPYSLPDFYFPSLDYGCLPHVEENSRKLCLAEDGAAHSIDSPLGLIKSCIKRAKDLIKAGTSKLNANDFVEEINSYWIELYNGEPKLSCGFIFYGEWPANDSELCELNYATPIQDSKKGIRVNTLVYLDSKEEPFDKYISSNCRYKKEKALFLSSVNIPNKPPFNISYKQFIASIYPESKKKVKNFLNHNNGGDIFFKLSDNSIAGIKFEKVNIYRKGFRKLEPCYVYEHLQSPNKNCQRLYGSVYTLKKSAERTAGRLMIKRSFLIVGLGSVGSNLFHFLLGYNNVSYTLLDKDILTTDNIGRHLLGFKYVNIPKVQGIAEYIKSADLEAEVHPLQNTLQEYIGQDFSKLNGYTAIFVCTGDVMTEKYINDAITRGEIKVPVFHLWLEPYGSAGHLLYVNPERCKPHIDIYNEHFRYKHNIIKDEEYDKHADTFIRRTAGCNGSYTIYSQNDVLLMLSAFYPIINRLIKNPSESKCYRWVGNIDYLERQGIEFDTSTESHSGEVQEFPL